MIGWQNKPFEIKAKKGAPSGEASILFTTNSLRMRLIWKNVLIIDFLVPCWV